MLVAVPGNVAGRRAFPGDSPDGVDFDTLLSVLRLVSIVDPEIAGADVGPEAAAMDASRAVVIRALAAGADRDRGVRIAPALPASAFLASPLASILASTMHFDTNESISNLRDIENWSILLKCRSFSAKRRCSEVAQCFSIPSLK
jgi:hypothetical protein